MKLVTSYFMRGIRRYPREFGASLGLVMLTTALGVLLPLSLRYFLEVVRSQGTASVLFLGLGAYALYLTMTTLVDLWWYMSLDTFGGRYMSDLSVDLYAALRLADPDDIERAQITHVRHTLYTDVLEVFRVVGHHSSTLLSSAFVALASLSLAFSYNAEVAGVIVLGLALTLLMSITSRNYITRSSVAVKARMSAHNRLCDELIDTLEVSRAATVGNFNRQRIQDSIKVFIDTSKSVDKKQIFLSGCIKNVNVLFSIALSGYLAMNATGNFIVNFVFFTILANIILEAGQTFESTFHQILRSYASFKNVDVILQLVPSGGSAQLRGVKEITLSDVIYTYPGCDDPVINSLSCTFRCGESVRVHGANGGGKTTFLRLITGLRRPNGGTVTVNGTDLRDYSVESIADSIEYLGQSEPLFNCTIRKYLHVTSGGAADELAIRNVVDMLGLPDIDMQIEGLGSNLSFGMRKKLLIARVLLGFERCNVIVLDEIDAGLDEQTRTMLYKHLDAWIKERSKLLFVINHNSGVGFECDREIHIGALRERR